MRNTRIAMLGPQSPLLTPKGTLCEGIDRKNDALNGIYLVNESIVNKKRLPLSYSGKSEQGSPMLKYS